MLLIVTYRPRRRSNLVYFSQAIKANGFVFVSGSIGMNVKGELVGETLDAQARQVRAFSILPAYNFRCIRNSILPLDFRLWIISSIFLTLLDAP